MEYMDLSEPLPTTASPISGEQNRGRTTKFQSHNFLDEDEEATNMQRRTDCLGRPQIVRHGESMSDRYKIHFYIHTVRHMEHRIGRINAVRNGEPVASWMDYSDERLGAELMGRLGVMDTESPKYKLLLDNYRRDRVNEIKGWMEEEEILKKDLEKKGLLKGKTDKQMQGTSSKEALFNLRTPIAEFTEEDKKIVKRYDPESFFPTTGEYKLEREMELLDVNPKRAGRDYFDVPRKPEDCLYRPEERPDIKYEHLELMAAIIRKFQFGVTKKVFWDTFVKEANLGSFTQLSEVLGSHEPMRFCEEASDIFYCPKENNPFGLIYATSLKDFLRTPEDILARIWHDVRAILGDRIERPSGRLPIASISSELKRIRCYEVDATYFGFPGWKEFCIHFLREIGNPENIGIFEINLGGKSYMEPELVVLRKRNVDEFAQKKEIALADYTKHHRKILSISAGTVNRTQKQIAMEANFKYMEGPEEIVRVPLLPGTRLQCFVDNLYPTTTYPFFPSVVPTALRDTWVELNIKISSFYLSREGEMAMIDRNNVDLVYGLHVVVYYGLVDTYVCKPTLYHRGMIVNRNSRDRILKVELYDRSLVVCASYDNVRLMTPEIYYFAPALSTRIRLHIDPVRFPRAVELGFKAFFKFTDEEMDALVYPVFLGGDLFVNLIEEFPSKHVVLRFWSATAEHESRELKCPFLVKEDPPILFAVRSIISGDQELRTRFVEAYGKYIAHCEQTGIIPLEQKLAGAVMDSGSYKDMTSMTKEDVFRSIDSLYPVTEDKEESVTEDKEESVTEDKEESVTDSSVQEKTVEEEQAPVELDPLEQID